MPRNANPDIGLHYTEKLSLLLFKTLFKFDFHSFSFKLQCSTFLFMSFIPFNILWDMASVIQIPTHALKQSQKLPSTVPALALVYMYELGIRYVVQQSRLRTVKSENSLPGFFWLRRHRGAFVLS